VRARDSHIGPHGRFLETWEARPGPHELFPLTEG